MRSIRNFFNLDLNTLSEKVLRPYDLRLYSGVTRRYYQRNAIFFQDCKRITVHEDIQVPCRVLI